MITFIFISAFIFIIIGIIFIVLINRIYDLKIEIKHINDRIDSIKSITAKTINILEKTNKNIIDYNECNDTNIYYIKDNIQNIELKLKELEDNNKI